MKTRKYYILNMERKDCGKATVFSFPWESPSYERNCFAQAALRRIGIMPQKNICECINTR